MQRRQTRSMGPLKKAASADAKLSTQAPYILLCAACVVLMLVGSESRAIGADAPTTAEPPAAVAVPDFWDPRRRPERPDLSRMQSIRFLTDTRLSAVRLCRPGRQPAGFNVDLARLICDEIKVACTIQTRPFDTLFDALNDNRGDAVIASIAADARRRGGRPISAILITARRRASWRARDYPIGDVRAGSGSRARKSRSSPAPRTRPILKAMFTEAELHPYPNAEAARDALRQKRSRSAVRRRHLARVLAQRHRLRRLLRIPRRAVSGEPLFRRGHRHRGQARQRSVAADASTGRCSGCGRRAASPICGCAIFRSARFERATPTMRGDYYVRALTTSAVYR